MKTTKIRLRQIISEEVNRVLISELKMPAGLKVLGDMVGIQPLPKLAKALHLAKKEQGVDSVDQLTDQMIKNHMICMDEFNNESITWVQQNKGLFPNWWVTAGGNLNPWFKGCSSVDDEPSMLDPHPSWSEEGAHSRTPLPGDPRFQLEEGSNFMKITESQLRKLIRVGILNESGHDEEERVSEMRQFSDSRSGKKVMSAGNKISSAGNAIYEIAVDQTGGMRQTLERVSEFVSKLGDSLSGLNSLEEGTSVTDTLPTVNEFKQIIKDIQKLEK